MNYYINVYPPIAKGDLPIVRLFHTQEEALQMTLEGCLGVMAFSIPDVTEPHNTEH